MNPLYQYFWPALALGLALGAIGGTFWFRRSKRMAAVAAAVLALAGTAIWHGPIGGADRFSSKVEATSRFVLVDWEMPQVEARLHRPPLSRRLVLSGQADEFQRTELVRIMGSVPGVSTAGWSDRGGIPLIVEALFACAAGFLIGLLLAYVVERRRRYNAEWKW